MTTIRLNKKTGSITLRKDKRTIKLAQVGRRGPKGDKGDTGPGVPTGGLAGQILTKLDGVDFNTAWEDPSYSPPDATSLVKGILKIAGDLGGTASTPLTKTRTVTKTIGTTVQAADHICDGTNDEVEFNAAITAVHDAGGGEIRVRYGSYVGGKVLLKDNIRLVFEQGATYTLANSSNSHAFENADTVGGNTNIQVVGLVIDGNKANQTGAYHGIHLVNVTNSSFENCKVSNCVYNNVYLDSCNNVKINQLETTGAVHEGIIFSNTNYSYLLNSRTYANGTSGMQLRGSGGSSYNTIFNLKVQNNTLYGLFFGQSGDGDCIGNTAQSCLVEYNGDDALVIEYSPYSKVLDCIVQYNGSHAGDQGIPVDNSPHTIVTGCLVQYNFADGIEVKHGSNYSVITGNICRNNSNVGNGANPTPTLDGCGIVLRGDTHHCTVTANTCYSDEATPSQRRGIMLTDAGNDYNVVTGNTLYGNSVAQVQEAGGIGGTSHNLIFGNAGAETSKIVDQPHSISNSTTSNAISIAQTGNVGSSRTKGAIYLDNSGGLGNGFTLYDSGLLTGHVGPLSTLRVGDTTANTVFDFNPAIQYQYNVTQHSATLIEQVGALLASRAGFVIQSSTDQTNGYGLFASRVASAGSTIPAGWFDNQGTGHGISTRVAGGKGVFVDNNGNGIGIDIDQDSNSPSLAVGLNVDITNAGTGGTTAIKVTGGKLDFNGQKGANAADPTSAQDVATKNYVDGIAASIGAGNRNWNTTDQGLKGWAFDAANASGTRILQTAGRLHLIKVAIGTASTISNVYFDVTTAGSGLTSAGVAIYQGGTLLAQSGDLSTTFQTTNTATCALTGAPISVSAGYIYVAVWASGTTLPTFAAGVNRSNINLGLAGTAARFGLADTGITTTAPSTLGTVSAASNSFWAAVA